MDDLHLDGNGVAGDLGDVFSAEPTLMRDTCAGCGVTTVLAEVHVYVQAPGTVLRCPHCDSVLMRVVRNDRRVVVDFPALARLEFDPTSPDRA